MRYKLDNQMDIEILSIEDLSENLCNYCPLDESYRGAKSLHYNCEGCRCSEAYENYLDEKQDEQNELDSISQQFDKLGLSIAELLYSDLECKKVYNESIKQNIDLGLDLSECMDNATNEVKRFVVERNRLESEAFEYFNLGTI